MSPLSSAEALSDYAVIVHDIRTNGGGKDSAVITFGGSYGGMLSSWMRILYPSSIDGAISASAPVLGFPLNSVPLDSSAQTVSYAVSRSDAAGVSAGTCANNLKMAWVLLTDLGSTADGRKAMTEGMNLCSPLTSVRGMYVSMVWGRV